MSGPRLLRLPVPVLLAVFAGGVAAATVRAEEATVAATEPTAKQSVPEPAWIAAVRRASDALRWSDERIAHDWRLQHRAGSDACRILDPEERVVREGSREECSEAFAALVREGRVPAVTGPTIVVLHGLGEGRWSMRPLVAHLRRELDATILSFGYASTAAGLDAPGRSLADVIRQLPDADPVSFVGHSMGNLVVRRWLSLAPAEDVARVRRMVMLGPPNQGSELARMVGRVGLLASLASGAGRELVLEWRTISAQLAVPPCPFGIVAGGTGDDHGFRSLLPGDDDAVERVAETRLPGACDFLLLPVRHAAMMRHPEVQRATATFLETGGFPAPREPAAAAPDAP
ncbi:MAG: esterase/lipase family protein [Planctomycetia bacterium]